MPSLTQRDSTTGVVPSEQLGGNASFPWDSFDSEWYLDHNYGTFRDDDRQILDAVAEFFGGVGRAGMMHGIDIGTGTNLYPALTMLPFCGEITLRERAATNYRWLRNEVGKYSKTWEPYWSKLAGRPLYEKIRDPRWAVHERARVVRGSIFDLPENKYDIGTMFFVAESITERKDEFERATKCFLRSLTSYAPFAAAFMRNSRGYEVSGVRFPAVAITEEDVRKCLDGEVVRDVKVDHIASTGLREGYDGMILVRGKAARR